MSPGRDGKLGATSVENLYHHGVRALGELQVLYHERDRDLRSVLKLAHDAAGYALGRSATTIAARDVRAVVALRA